MDIWKRPSGLVGVKVPILTDIPNDQAQLFNARWHSRLPRMPMICIKLCYALVYQDVVYGVGIWSHPVSNYRDAKRHLELRRLVIPDYAPKNTASRMLALMVRDIRKRFTQYSACISYQDTEVHLGTIYKAAGWISLGSSKSGDWSHRGANRINQSLAPKVLWVKSLIS